MSSPSQTDDSATQSFHSPGTHFSQPSSTPPSSVAQVLDPSTAPFTPAQHTRAEYQLGQATPTSSPDDGIQGWIDQVTNGHPTHVQPYGRANSAAEVAARDFELQSLRERIASLERTVAEIDAIRRSSTTLALDRAEMIAKLNKDVATGKQLERQLQDRITKRNRSKVELERRLHAVELTAASLAAHQSRLFDLLAAAVELDWEVRRCAMENIAKLLVERIDLAKETLERV
ncbi:hypothetical protein H2199_004294 [Coniosporium tulheliwenetii]|uniref:Uncharacterized protein n=1 Tax=Coniosporium tulheliwenetii TaxID=3383036 RepID=A0ACC2Z760_9PEZI|nr:hypothetical protein H2199_004294 [Cladosporium sp. JES 115]